MNDIAAALRAATSGSSASLLLLVVDVVDLGLNDLLGHASEFTAAEHGC